MTGQDAQNRLEEIVDAIGMEQTLENLSAVCFEKANHLRSNWQDSTASRLWDGVGRRIMAMASRGYIRILQ